MCSYMCDWTGGIYATVGVLGSRPGGPVAATWASMIRHGQEGYVESCKLIVGAAKKAARAIESMNGLQLVGRPDVSVVAWNTTKESSFNCYALHDYLKKTHGWDTATLQNPPGIHMAFTRPTALNVDTFIDDLRSATATLAANPDQVDSKRGTAGIYGSASSVPPQFVAEAVKVFLDATMATPEAHTEGTLGGA